MQNTKNNVKNSVRNLYLHPTAFNLNTKKEGKKT